MPTLRELVEHVGKENLDVDLEVFCIDCGYHNDLVILSEDRRTIVVGQRDIF